MTNSALTTLHRLLQMALEVELFTLPPYLTALYSIVEGTNKPSVDIIQSVAMEEMLHAALVANLMNAVGATPQVLSAKGQSGPRRQSYPAQLPHVDRILKVDLLAFSKPAIETFNQIEKPEDTSLWCKDGRVATIGELYSNLRNALISAVHDLGEAAVFIKPSGPQLDVRDYYGGGGHLTSVRGLDAALAAIEEISQQGEGRVQLSTLTGDEVRFQQPKRVAHFYRFNEILEGRFYDERDAVNAKPSGPLLKVDWSAAMPIASPEPTGMPAGLDKLLEAFSETYGAVLQALQSAFNGKPDELRKAETVMWTLRTKCIELMCVGCAPPFWFMAS